MLLYIGLLFFLTSSPCIGTSTHHASLRAKSLLEPHPSNTTASTERKHKNVTLDTLCVRLHNNTAFMGAQPFSRILVSSAGECRMNCIEIYPKCVAVMFYFLHGEDKNHVCYMFDTNTVNENVALIAEKPANPLDLIRALEIVTDCHEFDAFPPLSDSFVSSTDKVAPKKRNSGYYYQPATYGPWSGWSGCIGAGNEMRYQPCEYGQYVQRRHCYDQANAVPHHQPVQPLSYSPYPPQPYSHPAVNSTAHHRIMAHHAEQVHNACCYRHSYYQQQCAPNRGVHDRYCAQHPVPCVSPCIPAPVPTQVPQPIPVTLAPEPEREPEPVEPIVPEPVEPVVPEPIEPVEPEPEEPIVVPSMWTDWSEWSVCSATCGAGSEQRHRTCNGQGCEGNSVERRACDDLEPCQTWAEWTEWSSCRATCGVGERTRSRFCHLGNRRCDGEDYEVVACSSGPCPEWNQWHEWSACSVTCGYGTKRRQRTCQGDFCEGDHHEEERCELAECSAWGEWLDWSFCSVSCGRGAVERHRVCLGRYCEGDSTEQRACALDNCPEWAEWEEWASCSVTCGQGLQTRSRSCYGNFCPGARTEGRLCYDTAACSIWAPWQEWSQCSESCGTGVQQRTRTCYPGNDCVGNEEEARSCLGTQVCSQWAEWGNWSPCSLPCGPGEKLRRRECVTPDGFPTNNCHGPDTESAMCNERACCEWSQWASWSDCDRECGGGVMTRTRMCQRPGNGGEACHCPGNDREHISCNQHACYQPTYPPRPTRLPTIPPRTTRPPATTAIYRPTATLPVPVQPTGQPCLFNIGCGAAPVPRYVQQPCVFNQCVEAVPVVQVHNAPPVSPQCQWTSWNSWGPCSQACGHGVAQRIRSCVGESGCLCYGPSVDETGCQAQGPGCN